MAKLVLLLEDGATRDIPLDKECITLGRRADNDVCLPDPAVSGEHAQVVTLLADSFLEDLGSTNGTSVNGATVQKHFLHDGDVIDLGRQRLVYLEDDHAQPSGVRAPTPSARVSAGFGVPPGSAGSAATTWDTSGHTAQGTAGADVTDATHGAHAQRSGAVHDTMPRGFSPSAPQRASHDASLDTRNAANEEEPLPQLVVLTGPSAGRTLALVKEVTSVGRAGVQVAYVRRTTRGYVLSAGEGPRMPLVNGVAIERDGTLLVPGDVLEVAGARIEFALPPDLPT